MTGATFSLTSHDHVAPAAAGAAPPRPHAALYRRIEEDLLSWPMPLAYQRWGLGAGGFGYGGFGYGGPTGTVNDRRGGRDVPLFWSELDLRGYRVLSRHLCDTVDFAIGFLNLLTSYNVRKGFGWQACLRGVKKTPYPTVAGPVDPVVAKGQMILDAWRDANRWPARSREAFRRWRRDGEVFGRFFAGGWDRLPAFRFVLPEQVGSPTGDTSSAQSFGIETDPRDVETPWAYHVWDVDSGGVEGEWVDADRMLHVKCNVDSDVKRGLPDFYPVLDQLDGVRDLLRSMLRTAIRQSGVAWREKLPAAVLSQVTAVPYAANGFGSTVPANPPYYAPDWPWWANAPSQSAAGGVPVGGVQRVEGGREFADGPVAAGVPNYVQVVQAVLRGCCARWGMPEYATGDASNNNFASSLTASSPFAVSVEASQLEWGTSWERPVALKVLELARDAGLLADDEYRRLDVEVTEPAVVTPQPEKDTERYRVLNAAGAMCLDTWRQKEGLDPQHEAEGVKKDRASQQPPPGLGGPPGGNPPPDDGGGDGGGDDPLAGAFGESVAFEGFTGTITDGESRVGEAAGHFSDSDHPRDDRGRFVAKGDIEAAMSDPGKAAELRARVTDPAQRKKLDAAIRGGKSAPPDAPHEFPTGERLGAPDESADLKPGGQVRKVTVGGASYIVKQADNTGRSGPAEALAADLARVAGVDMPAAAMTEIDGRPALVQGFAAGRPLDSYVKESPEAARAALAKVPKAEIDKNVLFDYLLGNTDVHNGNYMVSGDGRLTPIDKEMVLGRGNLTGQRWVVPKLLSLTRPDGADMLHQFDAETVRGMADAGDRMAAELDRRGMKAEARQVRDRAVVLRKLGEQPAPTAGALYSLGSKGVAPPDLGFLGKLRWHLTKGN